MTTFTIYKDHHGEWRWHAKKKGRKVANCGEGYKRRKTCERVLTRLVLDCCDGKTTLL